MSYTDASLATFMVTEIGASGVALGLTNTSAAIVEAVNEVKALLGVSDIATLTDDLKTRTFGRWQAWLAAWGAATYQFDVKAGTSAVTLSQAFAQIGQRLRMAETAAMRYDEAAATIAGASALVGVTTTAGSPYTPLPCSEWA
jgi:hypothetical protein